MDLLLIVFLTLLNGVFAMSELAVASSRKARLTAMEESGDAGAGAALKLMEQPTQFLSTVQVGITSIGMLNGIVGEAAFSGPVAAWLTRQGLGAGAASIAATALVVVVITFTTIIFGELVPKRIGQMFPETVARWIARPMAGLATAAAAETRTAPGGSREGGRGASATARSANGWPARPAAGSNQGPLRGARLLRNGKMFALPWNALTC